MSEDLCYVVISIFSKINLSNCKCKNLLKILILEMMEILIQLIKTQLSVYPLYSFSYNYQKFLEKKLFYIFYFYTS